MIVVADTSPLNYLVLIDEVELLPALFGQVLVPTAVFRELQHSGTPAKVREWISQPPQWLEIRSVASNPSPALMRLDIGEREAIQLALELDAGVVLMDETEGRTVAEGLRLQVRGTLGVLERGAKLGKTDFRQALAKLEQTKFRISPAVRESFLRRSS
jgi:predicted nucleic acid-binding protein